MTKTQFLATTEYIAKLLLSLQNGDAPAPVPDGVDLAKVYKIAAMHSLAPAVYSALEPILKEADISDDLRSAWMRERELATVQHIRHTAAFAEMTSAFTSAGIKFLPIKGFIIKSLWSHPELRTMADMDIVVSPEDFERAGEALISIGFTLDHGDDVHFCYMKGKFINVELHRILYDRAKESFADWTPKADNPFWYEMSYPDLVSFLLRHAYKHYERGGCGIRAIFDFYLLFERYGRPDSIPGLMTRLEGEGLAEFAVTVVTLIDKWFGTSSLVECDDVALYVAAGGAYGTLDNSVIYSINKRGSRLAHLLHRVFPPYRAISSRYKWVKRCPILLPVAYLVRIFSAIFDKKTYSEIRSVKKNKKKENK